MFGRQKQTTKPNAKWNYQRDDENRIIVNMTVKDDSNFLSVFSENSTPVISTEVAEFIENGTSSIYPKEQLTLRIHSNCIDDEEKALYKEAIKEYYTKKYIANARELKRNRWIVLILSIFGVFALGMSLMCDYWTNDPIRTEVIDIVAWVLLWEAVDIGVFGNRALRLKQKYYLSYLSMKIEYIQL